MSGRSDRGIPGNGTLLAAAVVLALLACGGFVAWWKMSARAVSEPVGSLSQGLSAQTASLDEPVSMTVYLPSGGVLSAASVQVKRQVDVQSQAREIVSTLLSDERPGKGTVLTNVKLRDLYLDASGTAYVDLSVIPKDGLRSSLGEELLGVYAMVNTLMQDVEEIKRVRFLVEGKEAQTLAGHIDLSRPFTKRMDLVKE